MYTLPVALFIWTISHIASVNGYVAREDSSAGSPTVGASLATVPPVFTFNEISNMTTCTPATITWRYESFSDDLSSDLTLSITNVGVVQAPAPSSTITGSFSSVINAGAIGRAVYISRRDLTQSITGGTIFPTVETYTWLSVNVTAGWYVLTATIVPSDSATESTSFYVTNGSDTSCLATTSSSVTASNPTSSGSATSSAPPLSTSGVTLPVNVGSSKVNRGAIAGGVIGGLAVLAAAIAAYFYLRYASASTGSRASPAKRSTPRRWNGLSSTDSKTGMVYPAARGLGGSSHPHHSQSDSVGPMLSYDSNAYVIGNVGVDSRPSRVHDGLEDEDEINSYFSPSQEKFTPPGRSPFSDSGHDDDAVPLDLISPLPAHGNVTRNSSTSTSSYMNNNFSRPRSHPTSPYSGSPTSPTSEGPFSNSAQNATTSSLSHAEGSSYPPSPSPAYPSGTSQSIAEMPTPGPPRRRTSAGEPSSRRTPRKPVPQYNPADPALVAPPALPTVAAQDSDSSSSREGSVRNAGTPNLNHKTSFGAEGRPVHYLIPDMPPPQPRD
ncbi:hypothetical protein C8R44DRAFT_748924 [Mycena epipterygia]|nr:hypothetical protein C8R44DRAFT_748924 [Mycena epipterygia]